MEPVNLLKMSHLSLISRQLSQNKQVDNEIVSSGRLSVLPSKFDRYAALTRGVIEIVMAKTPPFVLGDALLEMYATNNRITRYMIENLDEESWRAAPPGGKGRTIGAIVAHIHNVRGMWLKAAGGEQVDKLEPKTVTREEALQALEASHQALHNLIAAALARDGRIKGFKPEVAGFIGYLVSHDAHHRGQIAMLARQSGHPLSQKAMFGMWEWGSR